VGAGAAEIVEGAPIVNAAAARIAVCFGGPSPEHDVSVLTGLQAVRELRRQGRSVEALYWTKAGDWAKVAPELEGRDFVDGVPPGAEPLRLQVGADGGFTTVAGRLGRPRLVPIDVVVVCCHGGPGEDGSLQGVFDLAGIAYTGPTVSGAALGMDKLAFAGVAAAAGLPVLPRRALTADSRRAGDAQGLVSGPGFDGPYIVKPRFGGSSLGIDVVADWSTALARLSANPLLRRGAVVEPYRPDLFDVNVAVRTWPTLEVSAIERPLRRATSGEILGYADKYVGGEGMASAPRQLPADLPADTAEQVRRYARAVAGLCQIRGVARVDFLSDGTSVWVNEVNTVPGSLARYLWVDPEVSFGQLLDDLIAEALAQPAASLSAVGADGTVLRSAGSIAAKLA
jgi:D-alanine-D-alanine ligase